MSVKADRNNSEQRSKPRVTIPDHPQILDAHSDSVLGQLVNLSGDGLMLVSSRCIERGIICQVRIPLIKAGHKVEIVAGAESLWCEDANDSGSYWTGFQIIDISAEDQEILNAVVGG